MLIFLFTKLSKYNLSKRVCLKLCFAQLTMCALSGAEAFHTEEYPVRGTLHMYSKKLLTVLVTGLACLPAEAKHWETKRINLPRLTPPLGHRAHNVLPALPRPELLCFWVTLSPSHRDYLLQGRRIMKEIGAKNTSPASTLKPGSIRQTVGILCRHSFSSLMKKVYFNFWLCPYL